MEKEEKKKKRRNGKSTLNNYDYPYTIYAQNSGV